MKNSPRPSFNPSDLLITNGLNKEQIHDKINAIKALVRLGHIRLDRDQEEKLERIITKSNYDNQRPARSNILRERNKISEKYFEHSELLKVAKNIYEFHSSFFDHFPCPRLKEQKLQLRESSNPSEAQEIIKNKTNISAIDNGFRIRYNTHQVRSTLSSFFHENFPIIFETNFEIDVVHQKNKFGFFFNATFKKSNREEISECDELFPEEIQIAMFRKLLETQPVVLEWLKSADKINFVRSEIENMQTLSNVAEYLENGHQYEDPHQLLVSTPNQNNTVNFINQLRKELGIELRETSKPKVIIKPRTTAISLKQSFLNTSHTDHQNASK